MKLSELVFECVRDSISLPNNNMGYSAFLDGVYTNKKDYSLQISGVFSALNLGFSRLYSYNKIPYFIVEKNIDSNNQITLNKNFGELINISYITNYGYEKLNFKILNIGSEQKAIVFGSHPTSVYLEYKKYIPQFKKEDLKPIENKNSVIVDDNIDLLVEYNITNEMCNYLKEFVKSYILEAIAPDLANNHKIMAEQYFNGIEETYTSFMQTRVRI